MTVPYIIYALPRSRTAWLSTLLTYGKWRCYHDIVIDFKSIKEIKEFFDRPYVGTAETAMVEGWKVARQLLPSLKTVVIIRPVQEIMKSLSNAGVPFNMAQILNRANFLEAASKEPGALVFDYDELRSEAVCKKIFEHCLDEEFDSKWWNGIKNANIQIDISERIKKIAKNQMGISSLREQVMEIMS